MPRDRALARSSASVALEAALKVASAGKAEEVVAAETLRRQQLDIVGWAESEFFLPDTQRPIEFAPHQAGILRYAFSRIAADDPRIKTFPSLESRIGHFPFTTVIYSTPKKGGKSTVAAVCGRYMAEMQTRFGEIYMMGNDLDQAKERSFKFIGDSIRLNPNAEYRGDEWILPGSWHLQKTQMECLSSGTKIKAISVDATGEAGANPDVTLWTEIWGIEREDHRRFWDEMIPVPTKMDSMRVVETYAGFDGESRLLQDLYELGLEGQQLTAGEFSEATGAPLNAFEECGDDPDTLVPIWVHERARMLMYWDSGLQARRMPWQKGPEAEAYYREQELSEPPNQFRRHHLNEWVGVIGDFVPMTAWDACKDDSLTLENFQPGSTIPVVLGVDAASTADCFGIVAVTRMPGNQKDVAIRAVRKWEPPKRVPGQLVDVAATGAGGAIDYREPENFIRFLCKGGCIMGHYQGPGWKRQDCKACQEGQLMPGYNVISVTYDSHQLVSMAQQLARDSISWMKNFPQGEDRLRADKGLYDLIISRQLHHDGNPALREHIQNAKARLQNDEDSTLRIVKKAPERKIDLAVAASMAVHECKRLLLEGLS